MKNLILFMVLALIVAPTHVVISQDTISYEYIDGSAILKVSESRKQLFWEIALDTSDMSQAAQDLYDSLQAIHVEAIGAIGAHTASAMSNYFLSRYDTSYTYDSVASMLGHVQGVEEVMRDVAVDEVLYGCYDQKGNTAYKTDPGIGNAWWILSPDYVRDQDLDVEEAWEFTQGNQNVKIGIFAGNNWCIRDSCKPEALWREWGPNIVDGIVRWITDTIGLSYPEYYSESTEGCVVYDPSPSGAVFGDGIHAISVMRTIVAHHDTTCCGGTVGVAPNLSLYPITSGMTFSTDLTALDFLHDEGCRVLSVSKGFPNIEQYCDLLREAMDLDILPIMAAGNKYIEEYWPVHQALVDGPLYVAGNVGTYRTTISKYDDYPKVTLSSAAPGGKTSFASATASAIAGLIISLDPNITTEQLRYKLLHACDPMRDEMWDPDTNETKLGHGRLSAYRAIADEKAGTISADETWNGPIFVSDDVIIPVGVTVTINLATMSNGVRRTHVRFASESYTKPVQHIMPKIVVYGSLVVQGEEDERILFSSMQRTIPYGSIYYGQWGGIEVRRGGSIFMEHALIENCIQGLYLGTDDAEIRNVEFCNVGRSVIVQNYDWQYGNPIIRSCKVINSDDDPHFNDDTSIGVAIWSGAPRITGCDISNVDVGLHYYCDNAAGELDSSCIHNTWSHGILCIADCSPVISDNRIANNMGCGVSLMYTREGLYLKNNVISNNGRKGFEYDTLRTADGLFMYNSTARIHANTIDSNRIGLHLQSFSSVAGGDGSFGPYGTPGGNSFAKNDTTILSVDHSKTLLGIYSAAHHYGYGNTITGKIGGEKRQAIALLSSDLWLQCNTWDPSEDSCFISEWPSSRIFRIPNYVDCTPLGHPFPDDQFELAQDYIAQAEYGGALGIYVYLGETAVDSIVLRAVNGFIEVYAADSLHQNKAAIDSMLDYVAYYNRNGSDSLKANIAYAQAILATVLNDYDKADSLYSYADSYLTNSTQLLNNLTSDLYLELYMQADTTSALSVLQDIESRFANDPQISIARDMFRYYVDIEANRYIRKEEPDKIVHDEDKSIVPSGIHIKQNYPNPFKESTIIPYAIDSDGQVRITIRDILGRTVKVLQDTYERAGMHQVELKSASLSPGIYICVVKTAEGARQITMSKIK